MSTAVEQVEYVSIERAIPMRRVWAMPNSSTFDIPPIRSLVKSYLHNSKVSVDPFARNKRWATYTNDLDPETAAEFHMEAADFLRSLVNGFAETGDDIRADLVLFDPPYSLEQCARSYKNVGRNVTMRDTQILGRWTEHKELVSRLTRPGGFAISFGWNSLGMGLQNGFAIIELLNVCHGGAHNDTIVTVERKVESRQLELLS